MYVTEPCPMGSFEISFIEAGAVTHTCNNQFQLLRRLRQEDDTFMGHLDSIDIIEGEGGRGRSKGEFPGLNIDRKEKHRQCKTVCCFMSQKSQHIRLRVQDFS